MRHIDAISAVLVTLSAIGLAGCGGGAAGIGSAKLGTGRVVEVVSDSTSMTLSNDTYTAMVRLNACTVVVEPRQVVVDGVSVAKLHPRTQRVRVTEENRKLTVFADGVGVYQSQLQR